MVAIIKPYELKEQIKGLEIINSNLTENQIIDYYQQALGLVFVSLHEGFGLPIAEAMACGVPVITSNTTSCKEIAADAALLVNPTSISEITNAMQKLTSDVKLQQELSQKGMERAKQFNWENTADQFYKILSAALKS